MDSADKPADGVQAAHDSSAKDGDLQPSGFATTLSGGLEQTPVDWWPESSDGQCSQSAALFAASQPAPLSIV